MTKQVVLVVDDDEATCTLMAALLGKQCRVETSFDGSEAVEKLRRRRYAALILDLRMPGADGYAVLDFLMGERPTLLSRVVVLTASLSPQEMERVRKYPVREVIGKPFDIETLIRVIGSCLNEDDASGPASSPLISGGMLLLLADLLRHVR